MNSSLYDVWWRDGDQSMEDSHQAHWRRVLDFIPETNLRGRRILDFGCNQGGFLRLLYERSPFAEAVGTDLAIGSIEVANARKGELPIQYIATAHPEQLGQRFDIAFSLAVLYLLDDLSEHARKMKACLKPGGIYYATYADYPRNPSFPRIRERINASSAQPMQSYSLDEIAAAFFEAGFDVGVRRMKPTDFVQLSASDSWYGSVADQLQYAYEKAYIFRFSTKD
ncbi:class I SAM-dependent methyltransferase [Paenibacillus sp. SYP-B4298]|uniref:class I SAM-dependent methyltransferase n=1 Tax=Paenibacillus sp. SYP-B4298 TaxID=2996034 RepID=UPI0022DDBDCF|nr:class I SAM-dependent methyltransferase [Paenibacillus sp. SYP-B4298]